MVQQQHSQSCTEGVFEDGLPPQVRSQQLTWYVFSSHPTLFHMLSSVGSAKEFAATTL